MMVRFQRRIRPLVVLATLSVALSAVFPIGASASAGISGATTTKKQSASQKKAAAPRKAVAQQQAKPSVFPAVTVSELPSGKDFEFASLAAEKKPILVWFWAPS